MLAMTKGLKTSSCGKSLTRYTGLGKRDTGSIFLTYKTSGTTGIAPIDPCLEKMQANSQNLSKRNLMGVLKLRMQVVCMTARFKAIGLGESCTVTENLDDTQMRCGD